MAFDITLAIKAIFLASITFIIITAVDDFIDRLLLKTFNLDADKTSTWAILSVIYILFALAVLYLMNQSLPGIIGTDLD